MSIRKRFLLLGAAAALVVVLVLAFRPQPERVETATVGYGPLLSTIDAEGITRVEEHYVISAPVTGFAQRIAYEVGDPVRAGDVIIVLEPAPPTPLDVRTRAEWTARAEAAAAAVRRSEAQADAAATQADLAAATLARMQPLAEDSILAPAELDRYVAEARQAADAKTSAEAAVEAARQELRAARAVLAADSRRSGPAVPVRAPDSGSVLAVHHESEGVVTAGQPLLEVGAPDALEVAADVLSDEATRLAPGMRALVEAGGRTVQGTVVRIEPVATTDISALGVEEQRVLVLVAMDDASSAEAPLRLGHGYRVRVRFVEREDPHALRIPTSALFERTEGWAAFVVADQHAHVRPLEVGQRAGLWTEVVSGLDEGQVVVTHPSDDLDDGDRVSIE